MDYEPFFARGIVFGIWRAKLEQPMEFIVHDPKCQAEVFELASGEDY